ncbi:MAG: ABC transporter permease [Actinobacteria bacterium]|nr:ABC transporter permease [Actinomycetota bacterium]
MSATEAVPATPVNPDSKRGSSAQRQFDLTKLLGASITFIAFLVVFLIYTIWLGGKFASTDARALDIHQNTPVLLLGLAVLVTLIAGQFDLSVASMATLSAFLVIGLKLNQDWPFALVLAVCLLVGVVGGAVNGFLVVKLRVNTFIATLGTGGVFLGLSAVYSKGTQIVAGAGQAELPSWFSGANSLGSLGEKFPAVLVWVGLGAAAVMVFLAFRRMRPARTEERRWDIISGAVVVVIAAILFALGLSNWVNAISWTMGVLLIVALVVWLLLDYTTYGRYLRATGSNAEAATLAGVNPGKETFKAFVLGGVLAALAGILLGANQGTASPGAATSFLLPAFAAAFLSTVILSTGRFHVWGTLIGGTFLVWVSQGLIVGGVPFTWTEVVNGLVLILAVAFSSVFKRRTT